jgi:CHAT domain-containing protein
VHFACHGVAHLDQPLGSSLFLADHTRITLADIFGLGGWPSASMAGLVVLSACETSRPGSLLPNEVVSFPTPA